MTTKTITDKLEYIGVQIGHMMPDDCANESVVLASYLSSLNVHRATKKQIAYKVALQVKKDGKSASEADIEMKASDEYREYMIVDGICEATVEMIHALKKKIGNLKQEENTL